MTSMPERSVPILTIAIFIILLSCLGWGVHFSTYNTFNVTDQVYFNWTSGNITIGAWADSIQMQIYNYTTDISPDYNQISRYDSADFENWTLCFPGGFDLSFLVQPTNFTQIMNNGTEEEFILSIRDNCPPGKYSGNITVANATNSSEKAEVMAEVNIMINPSNTLNTTTNKAYFKGTISPDSDYHSLYFNSTEIPENITGISLDLSGLSADVDIFLFDSNGKLLGKSINKGSGKEVINYLSESGGRWEIRIYGNVSSNYDGNIYFVTLNITNSSDPGEEVNSIDFGDNDANTSKQTEFTLINEDDRELSNVNQYIEVYKVYRWSASESKNFEDLLVPSFAQKLKVKVEWAPNGGVSDWDLSVKDPNGNLIDSSTDKYLNANKTNATREEFVVYTGSFSNKQGFWNISVRNQTTVTNDYNVTAFIWLDKSDWFETDFVNGFDFNGSGVGNYSTNVTANFTVPETEVLDGEYEGLFLYNNSDGWNRILPFSFNVSAGTLVLDNQIGSTGTTRIYTDNIGFNRTKHNLLISYNNTGSYPIYFTNSSSGIMKKDSNSNISFTVEDWPANPISPGASGDINLSVVIDTTKTKNDHGIYEGWIFFNTTNSTLNSSSYPYKNFNLTVEVNLTNRLGIEVINVQSSDGDNWIESVSNAQNISFAVNVKLINGTSIVDDDGLYAENFTGWMYERNVSSVVYEIDFLNMTNKSSDLCPTTTCYVNETLDANTVGGRYVVKVKVLWGNLQGTGTYEYLYVNNTGLYFTRLSGKNFDLDEGSDEDYYNISVVNYGIVTAVGTIRFPDTCDEDWCEIDAYKITSGCGSPTSDYFSVNINGNGTETCTLVWEIDPAGNVSSTKTFTTAVTVSGAAFFNQLDDVDIQIIDKDTDSGDGTTTTTTSTTTTTTTEEPEDSIIITSIPTSVEIVQGESDSFDVRVKDDGDTIQPDLELEISGINSSWYSYSPSNFDLEPGDRDDFTVTIEVPETAEVKIYTMTVEVKNDDVSDNEKVKLKVLPSEETKKVINQTYINYYQNYTLLLQRYNKLIASGANVTKDLNTTMDLLKEHFEKIKEHIEEGEYFEANERLGIVKGLLNSAYKEVEEIELAQTGPFIWIVLGIIGIIGGSFLIYFLLPTEGTWKSKIPFSFKRTSFREIKGFIYKTPESRYGMFHELHKKLKKNIRKIKEKIHFRSQPKQKYEFTRRAKWIHVEEED